MNLSRLLVTVLLATAILGCGRAKPAPAARADTTAVSCAQCTGSDTTGAICDTALDTTAAASAAGQANTRKPEQPKPEPEPVKVAEKPKELPRMWDFGSTTCIPCKTMKQILDPMIADYEGKIDIRIINVNEAPELTRQYRITVIPTQVFMDAAGKELFRHIGVFPRDSIEAHFREYGMPIVTGSLSPSPATECLT